MANHCSVPFSMHRIQDVSSLTPRIQFCETRWERFCRGTEVESGIFHCAGLSCHWPGSGAERGCGGKYSRRFLPQQFEKQRNEHKLFAEVGQPRKDEEGRGRSTTLQKWPSLHLLHVAEVVTGKPEVSCMTILLCRITRAVWTRVAGG